MLPFDDPFHWLDCNVFVQAKNGPYSFEIAPGFWKWLAKATKDGQVRSPISVYNELLRGKDPLAKWARQMKGSGLFVNPDRSVQMHLGQIAVFVQSQYEAPHAAEFLAGADPWVIAHAWADRGTVVTHETLVSSASKKVKIPNICAHFDVRCMGAYDSFRKLGMKL